MKMFEVVENQSPVAEGIQFSDGRCAVNWLNKDYKKITGMAFYDRIEDIIETYNVKCRIILHKPPKQNKPFVVDDSACLTSNPDWMCTDCTCWKQTRKNCS